MAFSLKNGKTCFLSATENCNLKIENEEMYIKKRRY